jgi:RND family efflux transporter MFP subunit
MKQQWKIAVGVIVVCIGLFVVWKELSRKKQATDVKSGRRREVAVAVETAPVTKGNIKEILWLTGSLRARSKYNVAPKVPGRLEKLAVDIGDRVRRGDLIAQLDDDEYIQQVQQAKAELALAQASVVEAKSNVEITEKELARVKSLHERKVASDSELEEATAKYASAVARYNVALAEVQKREAALKASEVRLAYTKIFAMWSEQGDIRVVGERFVNQGDMLQANTPIVSILDNSVMVAEIDVVERDYPRLRIGQEVILITDAYPGREFRGKVSRIAPLLKETSRQARVEVDIANEEGLLIPGMFVRVHIELQEHTNTTLIPLSALVRRNGQQGVFSVDMSTMKARFVPVKIGLTDNDIVEIIEPALSGKVVTIGHHLLQDSMSVKLPSVQEYQKAGDKSQTTVR